jgi:hypothetical protein
VVTDSFLARLEEASERYEARSEERDRTRRTLDEHGVLYADRPERVEMRLAASIAT